VRVFTVLINTKPWDAIPNSAGVSALIGWCMKDQAAADSLAVR
jgi:hypothetical protein